jgi:PTS system fructose-specific IIC component
MIGIEHMINEKLITLDLEATTKKEAIIELARLLFHENKLTSLIGFIDAVDERENAMSTYCGYDVAFPHAKSSLVKKATFAFGRTTGFSWGEEDGNVNFVFLLAIPESSSNNSLDSDHIGLISSIAELALEKEMRDKWAEAKTTYDVLETFKSALTNKVNV